MERVEQLPIVDPVAPETIERELEPFFLRNTVNAGNILYRFRGPDAPQTMRELGRIREIAFREAGGGTGQELDIDDFDVNEDPYWQLVVWDPGERMILGGYRYKLATAGHRGSDLATSELFDYSDEFVEHYLPYTIELGRSFVQPEYQSTRLRRKGIYALDNLWDGLGALVVKYPMAKYFFGKVTMYPSYDSQARDAILYYLNHYYPDVDALVRPRASLRLAASLDEQAGLFEGLTAKEGYERLLPFLSECGEKFPPLIKSYMSLSETMRVFGTAINPGFGAVEETGILVTIADILPEKIERYVHSFQPQGEEE